MLTIINGLISNKIEILFIYLVDAVVVISVVSMAAIAVYQVNMGMI